MCVKSRGDVPGDTTNLNMAFNTDLIGLEAQISEQAEKEEVVLQASRNFAATAPYNRLEKIGRI